MSFGSWRLPYPGSSYVYEVAQDIKASKEAFMLFPPGYGMAPF